MPICDGLSPPPIRHRASSTNIRPALTLTTLGRRRSTSLLQQLPTPDSTPAPSPIADPPSLADSPADPPTSSSMLVIFASRLLEWVHVQPKHTLAWSTPSSPRSSTDEFVLPLSASPHQTVFADIVLEKESSKSQHSHPWFQGYPSIHAPILLVIILFPLSTALVLFCLSTLPISISWPRTLTDLAQLGRELHGYSQSGPGPMAHVVGVMSITAVWKHAWSIPGSVIWNVLAGALFSPAFATILLTTLTTIGSLCATLLSTPLAPFLTHFFPRALDMTRNALEGDSDSDSDITGTKSKSKSSAWVRLSVLRLIGVVPWSGINIACGVCGVAITDCMLGAFIGSLPWTAVTCQIGDILQTVASTPSPTPQTVSSLLTSPDIILKLAFLSFLSLAPILGRDRLRALISHSASTSKSVTASPMLTRSDGDDTAPERIPRWAWVRDWRSKIRLPSHSRTREREQSRKQLEVLIQEKGDLERLPS